MEVHSNSLAARLKFVSASARPFFLTTVGKKFLMGVTGLIWTGFVFGHMAGNLLIFVSPDAYNSYGHALTSGNLIYLIEAILVLALLTHVGLAIRLTIENKLAKGAAYAVPAKGSKKTSFASRTMAIQGSVILAFVILHIATFKYGSYYETTVNGVTMRDLHRLIIEVFQQPGYLIWYLVSLVLLGFHLSHGFSSAFQSLGVLGDRFRPLILKAGWVYAVVVAGGFIAQPIYVFFIAR